MCSLELFRVPTLMGLRPGELSEDGLFKMTIITMGCQPLICTKTRFSLNVAE